MLASSAPASRAPLGPRAAVVLVARRTLLVGISSPSRGIDRRHYLLGKWLGLAAVISVLTVLPAIMLFVQYGMYRSNLDYWLEYWWMPLTICGYGLVMCLVLGLSVLALSVYLRRTAPIAITCFSLFYTRLRQRACLRPI